MTPIPAHVVILIAAFALFIIFSILCQCKKKSLERFTQIARGTNHHNRKSLEISENAVPGVTLDDSRIYYPMAHSVNGRYNFDIRGHDVTKSGQVVINAVHRFGVPITAKYVSLMSGDHELMHWDEGTLMSAPREGTNIILYPTETKPMPIYGSGQTETIYLLIETSDGIHPNLVGAEISQYLFSDMSFKMGDTFTFSDKFIKNGRFVPGRIEYMISKQIRIQF